MLLSHIFSSIFECVKSHAQFGHEARDGMSDLANNGLIDGLNRVKLLIATTKLFGKDSKESSPLKLIQSDICGPITVKANYGAMYFITFLDCYSRYGSVYRVSYYYEALDVFNHFRAEEGALIGTKT